MLGLPATFPGGLPLIPPHLHASIQRAIRASVEAGVLPASELRDEEYSSAGWQQWPRVAFGDWGFVYIAGGPFEGRFGYYDDEDGDALVYFGAPLTGDGPYKIPHQHLRKPPFTGKYRSL